MSIARQLTSPSGSFTRPKRRLYEEVALDFLAQSFQAKEKVSDISAAFTRSNMALAVSGNTLVGFAANIPRYDYGKDLSQLGLLFEPGVTNRMYNAQSTLPAGNNMTAISSAIDGPGTANNAMRFVETATNAHHRFTLNYNTASPIGNTITSSVVIRPYNRNYFYIRYAAGTFVYNIGFAFDPTTGVMTCNYQVPGATIGRTRYMGNGYWMLSATIITPTASMNALYFGTKDTAVTGDQLTDVTFMGSATSGFDYYWANVCDGPVGIMPWNTSLTGADTLTLPVNLENSSRLLFSTEFIVQDLTGGDASVAPGIFKLGRSGSSYSVGAYVRATDMNLVVSVINSAGASIFSASTPVTAYSVNKLAVGIEQKTITVALNGNVVSAGTLTEVAPRMTFLACGRYEQTLYGWLRKAKVRTNPFSPNDILRAAA